MEKEFIEQVNHCQGILRKVCNIYFYRSPYCEDYYQEILIRLWKAYPGFKNQSSFSTWLYKVALNAAIDIVRKQSIEPLYTELSVEEYRLHDTYVQESDTNDKIENMYQAINRLPEVERGIILLYLEGYEYKEIALIIGISETNVGVKINRIKLQLSKTINNGK